MKNLKRIILRPIALLPVAVLLLLFQNCGKSFQAVELNSLDSQSTISGNNQNAPPVDPNGALSVYVRDAEAVVSQGSPLQFPLILNKARSSDVVISLQTIDDSGLSRIKTMSLSAHRADRDCVGGVTCLMMYRSDYPLCLASTVPI